jgi:azurin
MNRAMMIAVLGMSFGLVGCGGEAPAPAPMKPVVPAPAAPQADKPAPAPATPVAPAVPETPAAALAAAPAPAAAGDELSGDNLELTSNDLMKFSAVKLNVPVGKPVKITLTNKGNLPKVAMGHNIVVLVVGEDPVQFGLKALTEGGGGPATDYIPTKEDLKAKIIAHTKLLGPGEMDTIEFTLPAAGEYPFLCLFPGHFATMRGIITAK